MKQVLQNWLLAAVLVSAFATGVVCPGAESSGVEARSPAASANPLTRVLTWMYQIQGLEKRAALETLARTSYDLLVVEPTVTQRGDEDFDVKGMAARLHQGKPGRMVLAYIDIGQAESYRTYWRKDWKASTPKAKGHPDFILNADPDAWNDSYQVSYWDPRWQQIMLKQADMLVAAGFDGLYLDWVGGYEEERVVAEAKRQGVNPATAMVDFIGRLRQRIRAKNPQALIVAQNAEYLLEAEARYLEVIDGLGVEDTWFAGKAGAKWANPKGGDVANRYKDEASTEGRLRQYQKFLKAGKLVFSIDYCVKPENAAKVYEQARAAGLVPLVTRGALEQLTTTPPPWLNASGK